MSRRGSRLQQSSTQGRTGEGGAWGLPMRRLSPHFDARGRHARSKDRAYVRTRPRRSVCQRQSKRGHFLAVPHEERIADEDGVVPGLAVERREARDFLELIRRRADEGQLAFLRK